MRSKVVTTAVLLGAAVAGVCGVAFLLGEFMKLDEDYKYNRSRADEMYVRGRPR